MSVRLNGMKWVCVMHLFIKKQVTLTGKTIHELLQTGENSLMNYLTA